MKITTLTNRDQTSVFRDGNPVGCFEADKSGMFIQFEVNDRDERRIVGVWDTWREAVVGLTINEPSMLEIVGATPVDRPEALSFDATPQEIADAKAMLAKAKEAASGGY